MLTRFELHVILRNQVADRGAVSRALLVEAVMEEFARETGGGAISIWGLAGLGADLDVELAAANPGRRGELAAEMLRDERAPEEAVAAVGEFRRAAAESIGRLPAALVVADALAGVMWDELAAGRSIDEMDGVLVARRIRRAEGRGDEAAVRVVGCAGRAGIEIERGAELAVGALRRVRGDLRILGDGGRDSGSGGPGSGSGSRSGSGSGSGFGGEG